MSVNVFCFYDQEDETLVQALKKQLQPFQRDMLIDNLWDNHTIKAGQKWRQEIQTYIRTAHIILLCISPDFMDSDLCYGIEMEQALERQQKHQVQIIPIILRHVHWQTAPFGALRAFPINGLPISSWSDKDEAFFHVATEIRHIIEEGSTSSLSNPNLEAYYPRFSASAVRNDQSSRQQMLRRVYKTWITDYLEESARSLHIEMEECPHLLHNPWASDYEELHQLQHSTPVETSITHLYNEAEEKLLILGEAGSGKTIMLFQLTKWLLERAFCDESHPLPVVFHLSSWSRKRPPLGEWLIDELHLKYRVPSRFATMWIQTNQILPLLDGFDEIHEKYRSAGIIAINKFLQEKNFIPIVVCSRTFEYSRQPFSLMLRNAVILQPLAQTQVDHYLSTHTRMPEATRIFLQNNLIIQKMTRTPLILDIVTKVYEDATITDIPDPQSADQGRTRLLARYIYRMLHRGTKRAIYSHEYTLSCLAWLAWHMSQHNQTIFFIEHMQFSWLPEKQSNIINFFLVLCFKCIIGFSVGFIFFLGRGFLWSPAAFVVGCYLAKAKYIKEDIKPVEVVSWSWTNVRLYAFRSLFTGLQAGGQLPVILLLLSLYSIAQFLLGGTQTFTETNTSLIFLAENGLITMFGVFSLLILESGWISQTLDDQDRTKPNQGIRCSVRNSVLASLLFGIVGGALFGISSSPIDAIACGIVIGIVGGLSKGGIACLKHLFLRLRLWRNESISWDYPGFLNYAVKRLLLRQVGGGYMFEHRMLQEHFSMLYASRHPVSFKESE